MTDGIRLIVGLGNPGQKYAKHRHNIGEAWITAVAADLNLKLALQAKQRSLQAKLPADMAPNNCYIARPTTYMNESGACVAAMANFYKIPAQQILIVHDELDLAPGVIKLKQGGGHAGHNGLRDIINKLSSRDFWRLRIGIGHPGHNTGHDDAVANYVLHQPTSAQQASISQNMDASYRLMPQILAGEFESVAMELAEISK